MSNEPVLTAVTAFVVATIALLVAFGVDLTEAQTAAIVGWVAAAYGVALLVRSMVTPTAKRKR
jgi:uncharacterized protein (DUF697 family)